MASFSNDQTSQTDPDSGTSTSTYDPAGQVTSATDARDKTVAYTYDADGRTTAEYDTTGNAPESASSEIASWTFDTLAKGMATSPVNGLRPVRRHAGRPRRWRGRFKRQRLVPGL